MMQEEYRLVKHKQPGIISFGYYLALKVSFVCIAIIYLIMTLIDYTIIKLYGAMYEGVEAWMFRVGEFSGDTQDSL